MQQLMQNEWFDPVKQMVGILAMAGIHHGPFPDTRSDGFSSTAELFSFHEPFSSVRFF